MSAPLAFYPDRVKAGALTALMAAMCVGCIAAGLLGDARLGERIAAAAATALFGWGLAVALGRLVDPRPVLVIDDWGVRDRRMKITAPWAQIRDVRIWVQEADAAHAAWVVLEVDDVDEVRALSPSWARLRRATLERWGRPPVALNVQGLRTTAAEIAALIADERGARSLTTAPPAPRSR
jgi:hypothetical protein